MKRKISRKTKKYKNIKLLSAEKKLLAKLDYINF